MGNYVVELGMVEGVIVLENGSAEIFRGKYSSDPACYRNEHLQSIAKTKQVSRGHSTILLRPLLGMIVFSF